MNLTQKLLQALSDLEMDLEHYHGTSKIQKVTKLLKEYIARKENYVERVTVVNDYFGWKKHSFVKRRKKCSKNI